MTDSPAKYSEEEEWDRRVTLIRQRVKTALGNGCRVVYSAYEEDESGLPIDNLDEIAYADHISKAPAVATSLLRKIRAREISCDSCNSVVDDARSIRAWKGEFKVYCPACHLGIRLKN